MAARVALAVRLRQVPRRAVELRIAQLLPRGRDEFRLENAMLSLTCRASRNHRSALTRSMCRLRGKHDCYGRDEVARNAPHRWPGG